MVGFRGERGFRGEDIALGLGSGGGAQKGMAPGVCGFRIV